MKENNGKKMRVMLVEDNIINQELTTIILEKAGCEVIKAVNGLEAVEKYNNGEYDLILMDIQMPEMDGYEATKIIRQNKSHYTPIIAMTAYAIEGDRKRCIDAGMDEYIPKPIKAKELYGIIENLMRYNEIKTNTEEMENLTSNSEAPINMEELMDSLANDEMLFKKLVEITMKSFPEKLKRVKSSIERNDSKELEISAHSFKGSIGILSKKVYSMAYSLEKMGKNKSFEGADKLFIQLENEMSIIGEYLGKIEIK